MSLVAVAVLLAAEYFVTGETFDLGAVFIPPDGAWGDSDIFITTRSRITMVCHSCITKPIPEKSGSYSLTSRFPVFYASTWRRGDVVARRARAASAAKGYNTYFSF